MTHKIHRSKISDPAAFDRAVHAQANELAAYQTHMFLVAQRKAQAYPPPSVHPDIDAAVRRVKNKTGDAYSFVVDYQIVDTIPVEDGNVPAFNARKEELSQQIMHMEQQALHKVLPKGKWRLVHFQYQDAFAKQEKSDEDNKVLAQYEALQNSVKAIQRYFAGLESQLEDLDFHTINTWVPSPFQG